MPSKRKRLPAPRVSPEKEALIDALEALALLNGRSVNDELIHAIERHLAQPPTVRVEAEPLHAAEVVQPEPPPKRRRGRPARSAAGYSVSSPRA